MKKLQLFSASFLILSFPAHAGGGAGGGATEVTQLLNHVELVMQVGEAVSTTANTLQTAQATMQMLRQLAPGTISQMTGLPIDQVAKMAEAYTVMSQASGVYKDAAAVLSKAQQDAVRLNISPSQLLAYKAEAATRYGGVYQQTYEQEQAKLRRLSDVSRDVQRQAETVQSIDANVKGIQFLASQNVGVQSVLREIGDSIATANANAALEAQERKNAEARAAQSSAATLDKLRTAREDAKAGIKLPSEVQIVK